MGNLTRFALSIGATVLIAGCAGSQLPIGAPITMRQVTPLGVRPDGAVYKNVYSFGGSPDGQEPVASLIDVGGKLYGTTESGGSGSSCQFYYPSLCGTVFSITPSGREKVLHTFGAKGDGRNSSAGLIDVGGTLYGTTEYGGAYNNKCNDGCGTVFSVTPSGTEKVLHSFGKGTDGQGPAASLIDVKGTLYGTTEYGGASNNVCNGGCGTVFSITPAGVEKVLHSFGKGTDGSNPIAGLINVNGTLYGTTEYGGSRYCYYTIEYSCGTVFSITRSGTEKVLHSFSGGTDGALPAASLIDVRGTLYGTTRDGGGCGCGTLFSVTPSGDEKVVHTFGSGFDGVAPEARLVDVRGRLYGTTARGGAAYGRAYGGGTVFSITLSGTEKIVHRFGNGTDGFHPAAGVTDVDGTLYGTTESGGTSGYGAVFAWTP